MRVLIVDDEANIRQMMRLTLEAAGYAVEEAEDGEQALGLYADGSGWDAVVLDQKMPGMEGIEVLKRIKERTPGARVVMVTAYSTIDLVIDAMHAGASDFVRKPMTPQALRGALAGSLKPGPPPRPRDRPAAPIETLTMNGFRILNDRDGLPAPPDAHRFVVIGFPDERKQTVIVHIDPEAVARVARLTKRDLPPSNSFWRGQAERLLAGYLWSEGHVPPDGELTVRDVSRTDLDAAARWPD